MKLKSSIRIAMKTKGELKKLKSRGETYDEVIQKLIDFIEFLDVCREDKRLLIERIKKLEAEE